MYLDACPGAFHDSGERFDAPNLASTRMAVIEEIIGWLDDPYSAHFNDVDAWSRWSGQIIHCSESCRDTANSRSTLCQLLFLAGEHDREGPRETPRRNVGLVREISTSLRLDFTFSPSHPTTQLSWISVFVLKSKRR